MTEQPELPLTLQQLRGAFANYRRFIMAAREHVGAAGLAQNAALEHIIAAGREQENITSALRAVADTLRPAEGGSASAADEAERQHLLEAGREQLDLAAQLENVIAGALRNITSTPVKHISAALLQNVSEQARRQVAALEQLIEEARRHATPRQAGALADIRGEVREAASHIREETASGQARKVPFCPRRGQVDTFGVVGRQAVESIAALRGAPAAHQIETLERLAETASRQAEALRRQGEASEQP